MDSARTYECIQPGTTMRNVKLWDIVQGAGAVSSVLGLVLFLATRRDVGIALLILIVGGVFAVVVASIMARRGLQAVGRQAMIDTGRSLIRNIKTEAVMFGGDMSWASDYEEAIRNTTSSGKRVRVVYPRSDAARVRRNEQILREVGAELLPAPIDSGLRALLVDPTDPKDALLYIVTRTLRTGAVPVQTGEHGSENNYQYLAKIYSMNREWVIIQAVRKVYEVLTAASRGGNQ